MNIPQSLHFVGIGGVGMSAIAQVWHSKGRPVSGSDSSAGTTWRNTVPGSTVERMTTR